ncbi:Putative F0F1-ATPase subunit Ca2+/Mg2+ transporter [Pseudobutyrivibrio sp. YE44]|uniref:AtpZ/AtpI family protein n=1 Tax=Pseudobutyrivibrio sp. YE44 TaxID=1520802 RepID=UPI00088268CC|nr:AtpZ/AtpI family protein [Pseudobutyrivibrio sp. YE44]SDB36840.1 Putative F0F1-ATPase subunit Ca2+/Mg2+ transporter [Pseudobutyrivibrio sp. YE44]
MRDKKKTNKEVANSLVMVLQFSINAIVPILLCTVVGTFLARKFDCQGIAIGGILIGILAAFNGAYKSVRGYLKNEESPGQRARRLEREAHVDNKAQGELHKD